MSIYCDGVGFWQNEERHRCKEMSGHPYVTLTLIHPMVIGRRVVNPIPKTPAIRKMALKGRFSAISQTCLNPTTHRVPGEFVLKTPTHL